MGMIHVLSEHIANKIAAGEVVERPSSIVKELIENSLDAGADSIEIQIRNGGKSLIRVADNGSGMTRADARLAFLRHATSKITDTSDLDNIVSFGFRGEALPSIAAVSRTEITTATDEAATGTRFQIEGGKESDVTDCAPVTGTTIEIRDLFFNTPARRKFLRADSTESGHISDTVSNLALANLHCRFVLKSGERKVYDLPATKDIAVRAQGIYGDTVLKHFMPISGETPDFKVSGLVGKPFVARANRTGQSYFINGRWVRSLGLSYALQDGFMGLLMHGKFPMGLIFVEIDPTQVDVNVHPTKQEVRLSNEREIKSFLKKLVAERLSEETDLAPHMTNRENNFLKVEDNRVVYSQGSVLETPHMRAAEPQGVYAADTTTILAEPISLRDKFQITKILGQIHNTFIVAETESGLILIDQHAAHERIMFETLSKGLKSGKPEKQSLLMDEMLDVHPRQAELFNQNLELLNKVGFEIDTFGDNTFVVRAYPTILGSQDPLTFLRDFLDEKEDGKLVTNVDKQSDDVAALIACKRRSVKAHDALAPQAIVTLLSRLAECETPFSCPHGRPSFLQYKISDLEHQFKRK